MRYANPVGRPSLLAGLGLAGFGRAHCRGLSPQVREAAAAALALMIGEMRQATIAGGVRPVPCAVSRALLGYFPEALLRKCRYGVNECSPLKLPSFGVTYGTSLGLTLVDVVLMRSDVAAQNDLKAWARMLTHVMQFQRWGVDEFARNWVEDRAAVEREATDNTSRFIAWLRDKDVMLRP